MRVIWVLIAGLLLFTSSCAYLTTVDQSVYRDIKRCNDEIDMERLEHPERNKDYRECMPRGFTLFRF